MTNAYGVNRLYYPYSYRTLITQDSNFDFVVGDNSNIVPTCNWFVLDLTPDEMLKFSSAMLAGLDLLYPNEFIELYEKFWLQPSEFPNGVPDNSCMDICQLVLDCINNNPSIQQAIAGYSSGSSIPVDATLDPVISGSNVLTDAGIVSCNNDNLFGAMTGLVDLMNSIASDIIEVLSNNSSLVGRIGDAIEAIPVIGELPVDDVLQLVENFVDDLEQLYQANYTVATRDTYRCDLFCIAKDNNCEITFEQIYDYFVSELGSIVPTSDITEFLVWWATNSPANSLIVPAWHVFLAGILRFGGQVLDIDSGRLITMISAMYNDPDSDWSILCDCGWTQVYDFTVTDGGFVPQDTGFGNRGVWVNGVGWSFTDVQISVAPRYRRGMLLDKSFTLSNITSITITYDYTQGTVEFPLEACLAIVGYDATVLQAIENITFADMVDGSDQSASLVNDDNYDQIRLALASSNTDDPSYSGSCVITSITITGFGANPF